ncbi:MAG: hypothetical protein AB2A00_28780 [Myxococcota bacterium]
MKVVLLSASACLLTALACTRLSDVGTSPPSPPAAALIAHKASQGTAAVPDSCLMDDEPNPGGEGLVQDFRLQVFLVRELRTCFVGDPCGEGTCASLNRRGGRVVRFADNDNFISLPPGDTRLKGRADAVCLTITLSDEDVAWLNEELHTFITETNVFTDGGVVLNLEAIHLPRLEVGLARIGNGFWLPPFGLEKHLRPHLRPDTDFIMLSHGVLDEEAGVSFDVGACGLTYGSDYGIGGAGYSWVPKTSGAFPFECAERGVMMHEWLHQVEFAQWFLSSRDDIYLSRKSGTHNYPPCGQAAHSPQHWFPSTHDCTSDPCAPDCGRSCSGNDVINEHVLRVHFNRHVPLVTNHCRNGIRDHGEHGVDVGGNCLERDELSVR